MKRALVVCALLGCDDDATPRPDVVGDTSVIDWCESAPVLTWDNFGAGFLTENCQPCHARLSQARHDAPEDVNFDTREDVALHRPRILVRAIGDEPDMPPAGGVSIEDRALLEAWLHCDFED